MKTITPMTKVTLAFAAGSDPEKMDIAIERPDYEFVFGIGSSGLTPFEYELADKTTGDDLLLRLRRSEVQGFFEHLYPPVRPLFRDRSELCLKVRITGVDSADSREVIKAMADMTARGGGAKCNCGGSCGCG